MYVLFFIYQSLMFLETGPPYGSNGASPGDAEDGFQKAWSPECTFQPVRFPASTAASTWLHFAMSQ